MSDPRLVRLRQIDAAATPGPWTWLNYGLGSPTGSVYLTKPNGELVVAIRNATPAVIELLESVLERHVAVERQPTEDDPQTWFCAECGWGGEQRTPERCEDAQAALAVLDRIGDDDGD
jgi:hypothetical protein